MKSLRMLFLSATAFVGTVSAIEIEDYAKGAVSADGDNLWHILAQGCDKKYFAEYAKLLANIEITREEEKWLSFLASEKNNKNQSSLDIAAEKWASSDNEHCADVIKMICAWKTMELKGHRSKKFSPFSMSLEIND
jgi:hypothetical protein